MKYNFKNIQSLTCTGSFSPLRKVKETTDMVDSLLHEPQVQQN